MNFNVFSHHPLHNYAESIRRRGGPWVFQHIPKTAGTSLVQELRLCFPPYRNIHITRDNPVSLPHHEALMESVEAFLEDHKGIQYNAASGHLFLPHIERIQQDIPTCRLITFLRDPAERVISEFRYTRTPKHPTYKKYLAQYKTLEDFAADPQHQDKMWRFLAPQGAPLEGDALTQLFNRFTFIGTLADLDLCFEFLTGLSGCPKKMAARTNVTETLTQNTVTTSDETLSKIRALNPKDSILYDAVQHKIETRRADMQAEINARRALYMDNQ